MGGLFGGKPTPPKPKPVAPVSDDESKRRSDRRRIAMRGNTSGRASTSNSPLDTVLGAS